MIKIKVHVIVVKMLLKRLMTWEKPSPAAILALWLLSLVLSVITTTTVTVTAIVSMNNLSLKIMIAMKKMTVANITWKKWTMTMTKMAMTK